MFLSLLARRTKRTLLSLKRSAAKAAALTLLLMVLFFAGCLMFTNKNAITLMSLLSLLIMIFLPSLALFFLLEMKKYGLKAFHQFDDDIIDEAFTGFNRKSTLFEEGLLAFHAADIRKALNIFTDMDTSGMTMAAKEQGVLSFYRGRCYQIMGLYPNALLCYEKAMNSGFSIDEMPLFLSRCHAGTGDTDSAVNELKKLIDTDHRYSYRARYEIGMIYIRLNDGKTALEWFEEAIDRRESYAEALGGAAVAHTIMKNIEKGEEYYRLALLNNIGNEKEFTLYFKKIQVAVVLENHSSNAT
jgi:tetratricopeptide (TPR) repeat protein